MKTVIIPKDNGSREIVFLEDDQEVLITRRIENGEDKYLSHQIIQSPSIETSEIYWEYEDKLPTVPQGVFIAMREASIVDVVRLYPYVKDSMGNRVWITGRSPQSTKG